MTTRQYYIDLLTHMPVNRRNGVPAPHKSILLLAIMDLIEGGEITSPIILINDRLIANFKRIWDANVPRDSDFEARIAYPFFHLSSSPFWELIKTPNYRGQKEYSSIGALERDYSGAFIDVGLYRLMKDPETRKELKVLLKSVFLDRNNSSSGMIGIATMIAIICAVA